MYEKDTLCYISTKQSFKLVSRHQYLDPLQLYLCFNTLFLALILNFNVLNSHIQNTENMKQKSSHVNIHYLASTWPPDVRWIA